jgi:hypothetical protein
MFFTFLEDACWNAEQQAVEFGVEIGSTRAWSGRRGADFNAYCRIFWASGSDGAGTSPARKRRGSKAGSPSMEDVTS